MHASDETERTYINRFKAFMKHLKKQFDMDPDKLVNQWKEVRYDWTKRRKFLDKWTEHIENYYAHLNGAPMYKRNAVLAVVSFFKHNKIPVEVDLKQRTYVKYHNRLLKKEDIRRILDHSGIREKAFFLVMIESGQRPRTLIQLRYKHIKEDFEDNRVPMKIELPAELLKDRVGQRFTFIGEDGFKALKEYLSPRMPLKNNDLLFTQKKGKAKKSYLSPETFANVFSAKVLKLKLDEIEEAGKPKRVRLYCLRKYFRNNIKATDSRYSMHAC